MAMAAPPSGHGIISCSECGLMKKEQEEGATFHRSYSRGKGYFHLCTSCILRLYCHSYCPTCFLVYYPKLPDPDSITCTSCFSQSHPQCCLPITSPSNFNPSTGGYICPRCCSSSSSSTPSPPPPLDHAKKLAAAAKIAYLVLKRAAIEAREAAQKRAEVAIKAKKKAFEALNHLDNVQIMLAWHKMMEEENDPEDDDNSNADDDDEEEEKDEMDEDRNGNDDDDDDGGGKSDDEWIREMEQQLSKDLGDD